MAGFDLLELFKKSKNETGWNITVVSVDDGEKHQYQEYNETSDTSLINAIYTGHYLQEAGFISSQKRSRVVLSDLDGFGQ